MLAKTRPGPLSIHPAVIASRLLAEPLPGAEVPVGFIEGSEVRPPGEVWMRIGTGTAGHEHHST